MKNYSIDRQNYRIFKSEKSSDSPFVHFFWGKFDFRLSFEINSDSSTDKDSKLLFSLIDKDRVVQIVGLASEGLALGWS